MDSEKIIKALECYVNFRCGECPLDCAKCEEFDCVKQALALITSQEQRIKELAEENERLQDLVKEVQEYNEAWVEDNHKLRNEIKTIKADTVRKMQERLIKWWKAQIEVCVNAKEEEIIISAVDQIAKEMLEGEE